MANMVQDLDESLDQVCERAAKEVSRGGKVSRLVTTISFEEDGSSFRSFQLFFKVDCCKCGGHAGESDDPNSVQKCVEC